MCLVKVQQKAPNFMATAVMPDGSFNEKFQLSDYEGKYVLLYFYPLDFTFVCPSEILAFDKRLEEFKSRDCEVIGVSVDSHFTHWAWRNTPIEKGGIGNIRYPLVSDLTKKISKDYGVLINDAVALRGLFIMDKNLIVRHMLVNDLPIGRSVDEALRVLDAIQYHEEHGEVCPANWKKGEKAMKPDAQGVAEYLSKYAK
ncbi:MAG TPA: peroxiredoxin [Candidatus Hydrogenedens sp.]|nr:peroxiredoxin [Candidatus Hydrogenedens sp.]